MTLPTPYPGREIAPGVESDAPMTASQFREALQEALRSRSLKILGDYLDQVDSEKATMAEKHRFMEWAVKTLGAESDKKATLPTVNISIGLGGQITATAVVMAEDGTETSQSITLNPTPAVKANSWINSDMVEAQ